MVLPGIERYFEKAGSTANEGLGLFDEQVPKFTNTLAYILIGGLARPLLAIAFQSAGYQHANPDAVLYAGGGFVIALATALSGGWLAGRWLKKKVHLWLDELQLQIRTNLLDGGLLRLALEHAPQSRVPALERRWFMPWKWNATARAHETVSMGARLDDLARNYAECCRNVGLYAYPPSVKRLFNFSRVGLVVCPVLVILSMLASLWIINHRLLQPSGVEMVAILPQVLWLGTWYVSYSTFRAVNSVTRWLTILELDSALNPRETRREFFRAAVAAGAARAAAAEGASIAQELAVPPSAASPTLRLRDNQADA